LYQIVSRDEEVSRAVFIGPCDRVSNKGGLCIKERQVVFMGGRGVVSRVLVYCCWKSKAIALDHE
jgi:hypothetical protein